MRLRRPVFGISGGALILEGQSGLPAVEAGVRARDAVTQVETQTIDDDHPLKDVLRQCRSGNGATFMVSATARRSSSSRRLASILESDGHDAQHPAVPMSPGQQDQRTYRPMGHGPMLLIETR
jgi:S1-C subfamily serine protease